MWKRRPDPVLDYSPHMEQPTSNQIAQARADLIERYTETQIDHFFNVLTDLPSHLVRISEEAALEEGSLRVTTKLTYQYSSERLPQNKKAQLETLLIPLFTPEKGTLIDSLSVTGGSGDEVTTLSQYDMRGLLALILETFFRLAKKEAPIPAGREPTGSMTSTFANAARAQRSCRSIHSGVPHKLLKTNKLTRLLEHEQDS